MELTHAKILEQPVANVSRLFTLLKLDGIRSSARNKAQVLTETVEDNDPNKELYIRWFNEIAEQSNRAINEINDYSQETQY